MSLILHLASLYPKQVAYARYTFKTGGLIYNYTSLCLISFSFCFNLTAVVRTIHSGSCTKRPQQIRNIHTVTHRHGRFSVTYSISSSCLMSLDVTCVFQRPAIFPHFNPSEVVDANQNKKLSRMFILCVDS